MNDKLRLASLDLIDYSFGTLWQIANTLWKQNKNFVDNSKSKFHPGISIIKWHLNEYHVTIPMLFGTSNFSKDAVVITGITEKGGAKHKTFFGALRPCNFHFRSFFSGEIEMNLHKTKATGSEIKDLERFLRSKLK